MRKGGREGVRLGDGVAVDGGVPYDVREGRLY